MKKISYILASLILPVTLMLSAPMVAAAGPAAATDACNGLSQLGGSDTCASSGGSSSISHLLTVVIEILSWVVGIAAVIMIIIGGFKYVTSGGDSNATASARDTLIYAVIGIVIVVLAQVLVHYVINKTA